MNEIRDMESMAARHAAKPVATRPVSELKPGHRVDLLCDEIADAEFFHSGDANDASHPEWDFEFETVLSVEREDTPNGSAYVVTFESGFTCGFPIDYAVTVDPEQVI